ncbi:MAG: tetratricopeptide repeat protein [Gemmatimonadota bacterium]
MSSNPSLAEEIRRYEEQYSRNPDSLVFARLADAYRKAGDPERALAVLGEGLSRHADYLSAHIVRARAYADLGRPGEAVKAFEAVLERDAQNLVALRALAELALERSDVSAAHRWLSRLIQVDPVNEEARRTLAALELQQDRADARGGAEAAPAETSPPTPLGDRVDEAAGSRSGDSAAGRKKPETSVEGADESEARDPGISWWEEATTEAPPVEPPDAGRSPWQDLWEREPEPPREEEDAEDGDLLTRTMAELYAGQGLYEEAIEIYQELLKDRPDDADLRRRLTDTRARMRGEAVPSPASEETQDAASAQPSDRPAEGEVSRDEAASTSSAEPPAEQGRRFEALEAGAGRAIETRAEAPGAPEVARGDDPAVAEAPAGEVAEQRGRDRGTDEEGAGWRDPSNNGPGSGERPDSSAAKGGAQPLEGASTPEPAAGPSTAGGEEAPGGASPDVIEQVEPERGVRPETRPATIRTHLQTLLRAGDAAVARMTERGGGEEARETSPDGTASTRMRSGTSTAFRKWLRELGG